jgi:SAM-dependent methyltransferase
MEKWLNIDAAWFPGVDIVRDLRRGLPFQDNRFDYIVCDNVLEHFDSEDAIFLINEMDRVLKLNGRLVIIVPHAHSQGAWQDPTHRSAWVPRSCLYWSPWLSSYGGPFVGITARLVPDPDLGDSAVSITGDMETEAFIKFVMRKIDAVTAHSLFGKRGE